MSEEAEAWEKRKIEEEEIVPWKKEGKETEPIEKEKAIKKEPIEKKVMKCETVEPELVESESIVKNVPHVWVESVEAGANQAVATGHH